MEAAASPSVETFTPEVSGNVLDTNEFRCVPDHERAPSCRLRQDAHARILCRSPGDLLAQQKEVGRLYNPYAGLSGQGFDPAMSRALLELPDAPEFLFTEEAFVRHRGWSENLTYITGGAYLGGTILGGAYGGYKGMTAKVEGVRDVTKLRVNRVLNAGGKTGRNLGNTLGVLGLFYASIESLSGYIREEHDSLNSIIAGGGTGALFKSVSGPRAAAVWGVGCVAKHSPHLPVGSPSVQSCKVQAEKRAKI